MNKEEAEKEAVEIKLDFDNAEVLMVHVGPRRGSYFVSVKVCVDDGVKEAIKNRGYAYSACLTTYTKH